MSATTFRGSYFWRGSQSTRTSPKPGRSPNLVYYDNPLPTRVNSLKNATALPFFEQRSSKLDNPHQIRQIKALITEVVNDPTKSGYLTPVTQRALIRMVNNSQSPQKPPNYYRNPTNTRNMANTAEMHRNPKNTANNSENRPKQHSMESSSSQTGSRSIWKPKLKERRGVGLGRTTLTLRRSHDAVGADLGGEGGLLGGFDGVGGGSAAKRANLEGFGKDRGGSGGGADGKAGWDEKMERGGRVLRRGLSTSMVSAQLSPHGLSRLPSGGKTVDWSARQDMLLSGDLGVVVGEAEENDVAKHNQEMNKEIGERKFDNQRDFEQFEELQVRQEVPINAEGVTQEARGRNSPLKAVDRSSTGDWDNPPSVRESKIEKKLPVRSVYKISGSKKPQPSLDNSLTERSNFERRAPDYRSLKGITTHFLFEKYPMVQFNNSLFKNPVSNNFLISQQCAIAHSEMYRMCHSLRTAHNLDSLYGNRHYLELLQTVNMLNERSISIVYRICFELLPNTLTGLIAKGFINDPMLLEPDLTPDTEMSIFFKNRMFLKRIVQFFESCMYHFNLLLKDNMVLEMEVSNYTLIMRMFERLRYDLAKASNLYTRLSEELNQKEPTWALQNFHAAFDTPGDYQSHALTIRGCMERVGHHIFGNKHHLNHSEAFRLQKETQKRLRQAQSQPRMLSPGKKYSLAHNFDKYERPEILQLLDEQLYREEPKDPETSVKGLFKRQPAVPLPLKGKHSALAHLLGYFKKQAN